MIITNVITHHLLLPPQPLAPASTPPATSQAISAHLVSIACEDGARAWGEAAWDDPGELEEAFGLLSPIVEGADPLDRGALWERMVDRLTAHDDPIPGGAAALSALDIALWDLAGRAAGMPVYQLLGGRRFARLEAYASGINATEPGLAVRQAEEAIRQGFHALKLDLPDCDSAGDVVPAVRKATGAQVRLLVDAGQCCQDRDVALALGAALDRHEAYWFEEPMPSGEWSDYVVLRHALNTPIAAGRALRSPAAALQAFRVGALDVVTPDVRLCGGITGMLKIAELARWLEVRVSPHNGPSPIAALASAHAAATLPGFVITEISADAMAVAQGLLGAPLPLEDGFLAVPDAPGLGFAVSEEFVARFAIGP